MTVCITSAPYTPEVSGTCAYPSPELQAQIAAGQAGYVHSVEIGSSVDGPGLRATVFLTGCPLSCQYCHNPDTRKLKDGTPRTAESVLEEIQPYLPFMQANRGGLTLSGGEPLVQPAFAQTLFAGAKAIGLHTALDTSGFLGTHATDKLLENVDLVLLDIKSGLPDTYQNVTHTPLEPTIAFAKRLEAMGKAMWIRFVLVPGLTDAEENVQAVASIIKPLTNIEKVEVLPFHNMGKHKWEQLGYPYTLGNTPAPTPESIAHVRAILGAV
jgi:pyruvate formate lyase activating enzyme